MNEFLRPILVPASLGDFSVIQKMWPFYVYDLERECGLTKGWEWIIDPSGEMDDLSTYFNHPDKKAFLVKTENKLSGFALISKLDIMPEVDFFLSEFFIAGNFQNKGIGNSIAFDLFNLFKGKWALGVIPENKKGLAFWRKTLTSYTAGNFSEIFKTSEELKTVEHPEPYPMVIFTFDSGKQNQILSEQPVVVRATSLSDIPFCVALSYNKRRAYEKNQTQFWKYAGPEAEISQAKYFETLLKQDDCIWFTAESDTKIIGFIIGKIMLAPEVYNPGGLTLMIDDFCVDLDANWETIGHKLINETKSLAKNRGATQILVVCGAHDEPKCRFLKNMGLNIASEWYVGKIT